MRVLPSLKNLKLETEIPKAKEQEPTLINESDEITINQPLTKETLDKLFQQYAEQKKHEGKMMDFTLFNERGFDLNGNIVILKLDNEAQLHQLLPLKVPLSNFIKKNTGINITVEAEIMQSSEQKKRLYTSSDKFKFLAEQYPVLEDLKRRLGLELDI